MNERGDKQIKPAVLAARELAALEKSKDAGLEAMKTAFSRPSNLVRGKDIDWEALNVDESLFENKEEEALWSAYTSVASKVRTH